MQNSHVFEYYIPKQIKSKSKSNFIHYIDELKKGKCLKFNDSAWKDYMYFLGSFNFENTKLHYWKDVELNKDNYPLLVDDSDSIFYQKPIPKLIFGNIKLRITQFRIPKSSSFIFSYRDEFKQVINCKKVLINKEHEDLKYKMDLSGFLAYRILPIRRKPLRAGAFQRKRHLSPYLPVGQGGSNCCIGKFGGCDTKYQVSLLYRNHYLIPMITMSNSLAYFATEQEKTLTQWVSSIDTFGKNIKRFSEDNFLIGVEQDIIDDNVLGLPITKKAFIKKFEDE